ncbi:MAG: hypothetical protein ABR602_06530 [Gemmatimonadales bacterium]
MLLAQVLGMAFDGEGGLVVADRQTARIHFVTPEGIPVRMVGGTGSGPGELRNLHAFGLLEDGRPWGYDASNRRMVVLSTHDTLHVTHTMPRLGPHAWPSIAGGIAGPSLIVIERNFPLSAVLKPGAMVRDSTRLLRLSLTTVGIAPLATVPRADILRLDGNGGPRTHGVPFGPYLSVAVDPKRQTVFWGFSELFLIARWHPANGIDTFVNMVADRQPIESQDIKTWFGKDAAMAAISAGNEPTHVPAFRRLLVATNGWLWVKEYLPEQGGPTRWAVFDSVGVLRRIVDLPAHFNLRAVNGDSAAGMVEEDDGEQFVRLLRLVEVPKE